MSTDAFARQLQNWDNFCRYHANSDWYGTWTTYSPDGEVVEFFQCVRSLQIGDDGREIYHQNHYTYTDGKKETKTFGPYRKPMTRALFLDNSFSWGSTKVESGSNFGFETGFRYEDRRASAVVMYNDSCSLSKIIVIPEHLASFPEKTTGWSARELSGNWEGTGKTMTPDWIVSSPVETSWKRLKNLGDNYLTLHFPDGISIICPQKVESGKEFFAAVDWRVTPSKLHRGSRQYDASGFTNLTLETFSRSD